MTKALEDQRVLADETSMQVAKVAFTKGVKEGSQRQTQPYHSSSVVTESACLSPSSVMTNCDFGLHHIHQLRPETSAAMATFMLNHATPTQMAANRPTESTNNGAMDGNKILPSVTSLDTRKRYKRCKSQVI